MQNFQQNAYDIAHCTLSMWLHYVGKIQSSNIYREAN